MPFSRADKRERLPNVGREQENHHSNCEQAIYQRQSVGGSQGGQKSSTTYSDAVKNGRYRYAVPTKNSFNPLN